MKIFAKRDLGYSDKVVADETTNIIANTLHCSITSSLRVDQSRTNL